MKKYIDATGQQHAPAEAPYRIVSLVPSLTELLFELGLGDAVVGRTGFCIHPRHAVDYVPKVGGTKDVKIAALRALNPTHVIVNIDENELATVDVIRAFVPHLIVTHPNAPDDNVALYRLLAGIFCAPERVEQLVTALQTEISICRAMEWPIERALYLIWKKPWMTIASDTYIARTLACVGWHVTTPEGGAIGEARYPVVPDLDAAARSVDRVLLSSEPFMFRQRDVDELGAQLTVPVDLIDGEMTSWYGSRAITGLRYLRVFRAERLHGAQSAESAL